MTIEERLNELLQKDGPVSLQELKDLVTKIEAETEAGYRYNGRCTVEPLQLPEWNS